MVEIVSGSFGAGHDAASRGIARSLHRLGYTTRMWDVVQLMSQPFGPVLRRTYHRQLSSIPASWSWLLERLEGSEAFAQVAIKVTAARPRRMEQVLSGDPVAIVSTHPFASQCLGEMRRRGLLDVPVATYLTDMSVHRLWVHSGIDLHLALHPLSAVQARERGAGDTRVVRPPVPECFETARHGGSAERFAARRALGLPDHTGLALVTGGSEGIGDLERAAEEILASGLAEPVVLCGRNDGLRRRLAGRPGIHVLGWVDDMPSLCRAVDVVVQNAGGFTSLETLAAGVPVLTYRCIAGHGVGNAATLDAAGWIPWVRSAEDLPRALSVAIAPNPRRAPEFAHAADVGEVLFPEPLLDRA